MSRYEKQEKSKKKHPIVSSSTPRNGSGTQPPSQRPGWRGPGYIKKTKSDQSVPAAQKGVKEKEVETEQLLPVELQQLLLDIFRNTFPASADFEGLKPTLQSIKNALFERDFERAFGREEYLEAYAIRWSPSRTLCYAEALASLAEEFRDEDFFTRVLGGGSDASGKLEVSSTRPLRIVSFGGGAAEVVAFGGWLRYLDPTSWGKPLHITEDMPVLTEAMGTLSSSGSRGSPKIELVLVDTAAWGDTISKLSTTLTSPPPLSKYASASARASNASLLSPNAMIPRFTQQNVLESSAEEFGALLGQEPVLITLFFTLNELYSSSISQTTAFLLKLTTWTAPGSLLLVIDSPGSYSEASVGKEAEGEKKKYPMHWLMDHFLLEKHSKRGKEDTPAWEKLIGDESRWYRLGEGLRYPVSLENMRYQVHLFRRIKVGPRNEEEAET